MTKLIICNWNKSKIKVKSRYHRKRDIINIDVSLITKPIKQSKIIHKSGKDRRTFCGIKYDNTIMHQFIPNKLAGYWKRVTCKNCLRLK